jgi:hypothetical protein
MARGDGPEKMKTVARQPLHFNFSGLSPSLHRTPDRPLLGREGLPAKQDVYQSLTQLQECIEVVQVGQQSVYESRERRGNPGILDVDVDPVLRRPASKTT